MMKADVCRKIKNLVEQVKYLEDRHSKHQSFPSTSVNLTGCLPHIPQHLPMKFNSVCSDISQFSLNCIRDLE